MLRPATGERFVGWVQPTGRKPSAVGCTHPTMLRSLLREVNLTFQTFWLCFAKICVFTQTVVPQETSGDSLVGGWPEFWLRFVTAGLERGEPSVPPRKQASPHATCASITLLLAYCTRHCACRITVADASSSSLSSASWCTAVVRQRAIPAGIGGTASVMTVWFLPTGRGLTRAKKGGSTLGVLPG